MPREENLLILKMLQDGTITAEQAAELLNALDASEARTAPAAPSAPVPPIAAASPIPPVPPVPPVPPIPPTPPTPPTPPIAPSAEQEAEEVPEVPEGANDPFARARARIAAARERVSGVQEKLTAVEERLNKAEGETPTNPWASVADALKDVPGARAIGDALRDPSRFAANARRQARRMARQVRSSIGDLNLDIHLNLGETMQGEPTLSAPREVMTPIETGAMLRVRNPLGDIDAVGADVPEVRVAGVLKVWASDRATAETAAAQVTLTVEQTSEGPTVVVSHSPKVRRCVLDLKVFVPQSGVRVSLLSPAGDVSVRNHKGGVVLATQSGDAKAADVAGDVAAETASGDIALEGILGNAQGTSASGDIQAIRLSGQTFKALSQSGDVTLRDSAVPAVNVETVSGDVELKGITSRTLRIRAVSGDVEVLDSAVKEDLHLDTVSGYVEAAPRGPLSAGRVTLASVSGDLELKLPRITNATIDVSTKGGDVKAKFSGADDVEKTMNGSGMVTLSETIGGGVGARISLTSVSGDLEISQESPVVEMS